jgi:hypothetical protein
MKSLNRSLIGTALLTLATVASSPAHAVFVASICDDLACSGGNDITVQDNGAGDTIGALGGISFSTSAFGYSLLVNTSQSKPMLGSATDTDFVSSGSFILALGGTNSGGSGTVTGRAWGGTNNTALSFSGANLLGTSGAQSGVAFSNSVAGGFSSAVNPYSLTIGVAVNRTTAGTSTGDLNLQVTAIPEPETYALMLAGLGMLGAVARRRKAG